MTNYPTLAVAFLMQLGIVTGIFLGEITGIDVAESVRTGIFIGVVYVMAGLVYKAFR